MERVSQLKLEINGLLIKEEKMWRQRSRSLWLHEGDQNTRFFHNQASNKYRRNQIEELQNSRGEMCKEEEDIAQILITHYQELFHSANLENIEHVLSAIPTMVTPELNNMLSTEFVKEEVDKALKQMDPLKAPGPDGLPPLFFQKFWSTIGEEVSQAILTCLNSSSFPSTINRTFITLIPKVKNPCSVSNLRPISLCNIIYKLVSKVVANRLKKVLPFIIFESQSVFQSNKAIHYKRYCYLRRNFFDDYKKL